MFLKKIKFITGSIFIAICICVLCVLTSCASSESPKVSSAVSGLQHHEGYTLEQMTVVSRHQIRSALSEHGSDLAKINSHEWLP